jgi:hypothetical protein
LVDRGWPGRACWRLRRRPTHRPGTSLLSGKLGHADIPTTRIYDQRKMKPEDSPSATLDRMLQIPSRHRLPATTVSPRTGPRRTGAGARGTGQPRGDCRSQYSLCPSRRSMDTVGGARAKDRANRPGASEMPPNITLRTRVRITALLAG